MDDAPEASPHLAKVDRFLNAPATPDKRGFVFDKKGEAKMDFRKEPLCNQYDNSTCNSSGLVGRLVPDLLPRSVLGCEQAAPGNRGV
jgi:hypothetical protein